MGKNGTKYQNRNAWKSNFVRENFKLVSEVYWSWGIGDWRHRCVSLLWRDWEEIFQKASQHIGEGYDGFWCQCRQWGSLEAQREACSDVYRRMSGQNKKWCKLVKRNIAKKGQLPVFIFSKKKKLPEFGQYQPILYQPKLNISVWFRRIRKGIIIKSIASMWSNLQACHF